MSFLHSSQDNRLRSKATAQATGAADDDGGEGEKGGADEENEDNAKHLIVDDLMLAAAKRQVRNYLLLYTQYICVRV